MAECDRDGRFQLVMNEDKTQVTLTVAPPKAAGRSVTVPEVVEELRRMGVMYGIRESEIGRAVKVAHETGLSSPAVVAAQGQLPEDGVDAQTTWRIDLHAIQHPMPQRIDGIPDYFAYDPERMVKAGQVLLNVTPARAGTPGKTLLAPFAAVPQAKGRDTGITAGSGVRMSEDRLQFTATADGCAELIRDRLVVHPIRWIDGDLEGDTVASGGLVVMGNMRSGGSIKARGVVAVKGSLAGVKVRARGDVFVTRAARSTIVADGNVYVLEQLLNCEVNCHGKLIALDGASIAGGDLLATGGIDAMDLGADNGTYTTAAVAVDGLNGVRSTEIQEEIAACEATAQKIGATLRPLAALPTAALPPDKRELIQRLMDERRNLEDRVRELHGERRQLTVTSKEKIAANVVVRGTVYPGVEVKVGQASNRVDQALCCVFFTEGADPLHIAVRPWKETRVA